jgi:glycosyltransferase involved in cell wall biosynthesis
MDVGLSLLTLFPGRAGGAETYVRGLLGAFAAGEGPELATLLTSRYSGPSVSEFVGERIRVVPVDSYRPGNSRLTRLIAMQTARLNNGRIAGDVPTGLDLIHFPVTVPIPKVKGLPTVVSLLDVQHHDLPAMFSPAERAFRRWGYDNAARQANQVITITQFSADRITELLGIAADRVHAIHLGIDHDLFTPNGPAATVAGLPDRYLYYPANSWPHKNHRRLIEAFSRVDDPELGLVLTGANSDVLNLRADDARVHHLGHIAETEVAGLYRGAEALIFPSLYEGFGLPPLEAMACGCPVAASNVGAVAEVCGDAALLFDPEDVGAIADVITRVTTEESLRAELAAAGTARAAEFTWRKTARKHLEVYQQALAGGAGQ